MPLKLRDKFAYDQLSLGEIMLRLDPGEGRIRTAREFKAFLDERKITLLKEITKPFVESFKVWRAARIRTRNFSSGATSLPTTRRFCTGSSPLAMNTKSSKRTPFAWKAGK